MDKEIWKAYPEVSFIQGSNLGRVRTVDRYVSDKRYGERFVKGRILKQYRHNNGYLYVHFSVNGKQVNRRVHRLVAQAFIPNPDNLPEVNHRDNNPANNNVSNLEWCTGEYNIAYREKHGVACNHPVIAVDLTTLEVSRFPSQMEASRELGASQSNLNSVIKGQRKTAGGYWFTIADENAVEATKNKLGDIVAHKVEQLIEQQWLNDFINEMQPA